MPDLSVLLAYLPDFSSWWHALQVFAGDNLPWVLVGLVAIGWILHVLLLKSLLKIVFGAIGYGIKSILYWVTYVFWAVLKWLGRLFGRGVKAGGRGAKAVGRKGKTSFKHHPWWGSGIIIGGLLWLHISYPYSYPGWGYIIWILWFFAGVWGFLFAVLYVMPYALRKPKPHRG